MAVYVDRIFLSIRESGDIKGFTIGTSIPNLDHHGLLNGYPVFIPNHQILEKFLAFVRPIYQKLYNSESRILAETRDALLPKLISGEVRVENKENFIEGTS